MAGPIPLLGLLDELRDFANRRNMGQKLVGGGIRGAATRGLLGMDAPEDATPLQREVYENAVRLSAPAQGLTALKAATVFHGSPHKFTKFDPKKIGTGEGMQAFGHGLYFAESPNVASDYRRKLSSFTNLVDGQVSKSGIDAIVGNQIQALGADKAKQYFLQSADEYARIGQSYKPALETAAKYRAYADHVDQLSGKSFSKNEGAIYKIDLPDEAIARMLDWDKPLSQQPESVQALARSRYSANPKYISIGRDSTPYDWDAVEDFLGKYGVKSFEQLKEPNTIASLKQKGIDVKLISSADERLSGMTGGDFYKALSSPSNTFKMGTAPGSQSANIAEQLRQAGIPGIRYLDQGSRGTGQGTSNFVVFPGEEDLLRILERNGVPIQSLLD